MPVRANMLTLRQAGLTLVELLVAMVLMLLVAIATVAMYNVSSSSHPPQKKCMSTKYSGRRLAKPGVSKAAMGRP